MMLHRRGSYVHQYPERFAALLLSRRLSDKTALSEQRVRYRSLLHSGAPMAISILNDLLLFSILVTVVTGIVIAAASLLV
jgi:hypothetical protein